MAEASPPPSQALLSGAFGPRTPTDVRHGEASHKRSSFGIEDPCTLTNVRRGFAFRTFKSSLQRSANGKKIDRSALGTTRPGVVTVCDTASASELPNGKKVGSSPFPAGGVKPSL